MTVHTCTMRVEKVCKVREEPAPRLAAERDALGPHCLECLAASASWDFWGFPEAQCRFSLRTGTPPSFRHTFSIDNGFGPFGRGGRAALLKLWTP